MSKRLKLNRPGKCRRFAWIGIGAGLLLQALAGRPISGAIDTRIERDLREALAADRRCSADVAHPSTMAPARRKAFWTSERANFDSAVSHYRKVARLLAAADRSHRAVPARLAARALALSAWGLFHSGNWPWVRAVAAAEAALRRCRVDATADIIAERLYFQATLLVGVRHVGYFDPRTQKVVWRQANVTPKQAALHRHYLLKSAFYTERALRIAPADPVANYDLFCDLRFLRMAPNTRGYYLAMAWKSRARAKSVYFHFNENLIANFRWNVEGQMAISPAWLTKLKTGSWSKHPPALPPLPPDADSPDPPPPKRLNYRFPWRHPSGSPSATTKP